MTCSSAPSGPPQPPSWVAERQTSSWPTQLVHGISPRWGSRRSPQSTRLSEQSPTTILLASPSGGETTVTRFTSRHGRPRNSWGLFLDEPVFANSVLGNLRFVTVSRRAIRIEQSSGAGESRRADGHQDG